MRPQTGPALSGQGSEPYGYESHEAVGLGPEWEPARAPAKVRSLGTCILLYVVTFGIYSLFWLYLVHKENPRRRDVDPTPGKAVGFLFIPFFNLYWLFKVYLSLTDRINLLALHLQGKKQPPVNKTLAIVFLVCMFIPYIGGLPSMICQIMWWVAAQGALNELAAGNKQA